MKDVGVNCFEGGEECAEKGEDETPCCEVVIAVCADEVLQPLVGGEHWAEDSR